MSSVAPLVSPTAQIASTTQIGVSYRALQEGEWTRLNRPTFVGERCDIGHFCVIGEESHIGEGSIIDAYCMVEGGVTLGKNVLLTHRASVGAKVTIGDNCIIGGTLICEKSQMGNNCRVFGSLTHRQLNPTLNWDAEEAEEPAPILADNVFVGWGATIIGGVNIGEGSYICAGATVTKDVPAHHIVTGTNQIQAPADWNGALGKSPFFAES
ncbi:DapH/DapD/GlmU-related protein [Amycolatopsis sp.]|uniref:DapH/DapD/GlmU-related protein n=1 Tax=Amycolatopsis sp. TaxID=37632 RepID=UPI002E01CFB3|nr:DapH/DapD/GlmU-related protein [Amycolatopsis sp.]